MRVGIAQIDCEVGDLDLNTKNMVEYVEEAAGRGCSVIVFPEMSDTGYLMPVIVERGASWESGPIVQLREAARRNGIHVIAGLSEREGNSVFNAIASISPEGDLKARYRKTHLITAEPMFEHHHLGTGEDLILSEVGGITCGFMTCYDVRFPEVSRCLTLAGAEVIFLPSAFPLLRLSHWKTLTEARAIENQLFVVAANRIGTDGPGLTFCGASRVIDPYGTILTSASEIEEKLLIADLDISKVVETRMRMQVLKDRRPELYAREVRR